MLQSRYIDVVTLMAGWDNRLRMRQSLRWGARGLAAGLGVGVLLSLVARVLPVLDRITLLMLTGVAGLVGIVVALLAVWIRRQLPLEMAREFDSIFGLREQVSTAIELAEGRLAIQSQPLAGYVMQDAFETASKVDASQLRIDPRLRDLLPVIALVVALAGALLLPNPKFNIVAEQREVAAAIDEQVERLEALREEIVEDTSFSQAERDEIVEVLTRGIERLDERGLSREEAVAELSELESELRQQSDDIERHAADLEDSLQQAGDSFSTDGLSEELGESLQQGDFARAADLLNNLVNPQGPPLTADQQEALGNELNQAADQVQGANPDLADDLRSAADAVQQGDEAAAQQALRQASQQLSQSSDQVAQSQASSQAASDAAAQSQQGQQSVAQAGRDGQSAQQGGQNSAAGTGPAGDGPAGDLGQQPGSGQQGGLGQQIGGGSGTGPGTDEAEGVVAGPAMQTSNDPQRDEQRDFESIFAPQLLGGESETSQALPGEGEVGDVVVSESDFVDNPSGEAQVPYNQVFSDYADAANDALEGEHVPLGLRDLIRNYFSSLDPNS